MRAALVFALLLVAACVVSADEFCPLRRRGECNTQRVNHPKFAHTMICPVANLTVNFGETNFQTSYLEGEISATAHGGEDKDPYWDFVSPFAAPWSVRPSLDNPTIDEIQAACKQYRDMFAWDSKVFVFESGDGRPIIISQDARFGGDSSDTPYGFAPEYPSGTADLPTPKIAAKVGYSGAGEGAGAGIHTGYQAEYLSVTGQWLYSVCNDGAACTDATVPRPLFGAAIGAHPEDFWANVNDGGFSDINGIQFVDASDHHMYMLGARLHHSCSGNQCYQVPDDGGMFDDGFQQNSEDGSWNWAPPSNNGGSHTGAFEGPSGDALGSDYTSPAYGLAEPEQPVGISSAYVTAPDGAKILVLLVGGVVFEENGSLDDDGDEDILARETNFLAWCVDEACSDWNVIEINFGQESNFNRGSAPGGSMVSSGNRLYFAFPVEDIDNDSNALDDLDDHHFAFGTATIETAAATGIPGPMYTRDCGKNAGMACLGPYWMDVSLTDETFYSSDDINVLSGFGLTTNCEGDVFFFINNGNGGSSTSPLEWYAWDSFGTPMRASWPDIPTEYHGGISPVAFHGAITLNEPGVTVRRIFGDVSQFLQSSNGQPFFTWADVGGALGDGSASSTWGVCGFHPSDSALQNPVCHTVMDTVELGLSGYVDTSFGKVLATTGPEGLPVLVYYFMHNGGYEEDSRDFFADDRYFLAAYRDTPAPGQVTNRPLIVHCLDALCDAASISSFVDERMADIVNWSDEAPTHLFHYQSYHPDTNAFDGDLYPRSSQVDIQRATNPTINAHASIVGDEFILAVNEGGYSNEHGGNPIRIWRSNRWTSPNGNPCSEGNVGEKVIADGVVYMCTRVRVGSDNARLYAGTTPRPWTRLYEWVDLSWGFGLRSSLGGFLSFPRDETKLFNTVSDLNPQFVDNWDQWLNQQPWLLVPNMFGPAQDNYRGPGKEDVGLLEYLQTYDSSSDSSGLPASTYYDQLFGSTYMACRLALQDRNEDMLVNNCYCEDNVYSSNENIFVQVDDDSLDQVGNVLPPGFFSDDAFYSHTPGRCWPWLESMYAHWPSDDVNSLVVTTDREWLEWMNAFPTKCLYTGDNCPP